VGTRARFGFFASARLCRLVVTAGDPGATLPAAMSEALDTIRWVPAPADDWRLGVAPLVEGLRGRRICVVTGAGCSTASGIPDYRGEGTAQRARNPIQFRQFIQNEAQHRRYWARAMQGYPKFVSAAPSEAHLALAALERQGHVVGLITQNVDRLHQQAGSRRVVELHGAMEEVVCLSCRAKEARALVQARLVAENPAWQSRLGELAPDGDADLDGDYDDFVAPRCTRCAGMLKPDVVFFGEGVPKGVVDEALGLLDEAEVLLVAGSSLTVFSGYRFVRQAVAGNKPVFVVNIGSTRADAVARHVVRGRVGDVLDEVVAALG
jgi:NAD-dependent SIR2 family protein deacetylase